MKKRLLALLKKKEERKKELGNTGTSTESIEELRSINKEIETLNGEIAELRGLIDDIPDEEDNPEAGEEGDNPEQRNNQQDQMNVLGTYGVGGGRQAREEEQEKENWEERGQDLYDSRAVTVSSGDLVIPKHTSPNIKGTFNQVSTLIDRVRTVPLQGGESYETPYEIEHGEGNYTAEGEPYHEIDTEFGYARINKTKITAYNEITEEVLKLPRANYGQRVVASVRGSLRKKITKEILNGRGPSQDEFVGIFSDQATAINPATDISISEIDADTLDTIIYAYGGDEDVEDASVLILSKDDLRKFSLVKHPDGRKVYDIKNNGNTGTINGVEFVINSGAGSLSVAAEGDYLMAYGPLSNYEMAIFSATEVKRSDDYKFREGMIAHRGSVFSGGNVASFNGFLRVKKGAVEPEV